MIRQLLVLGASGDLWPLPAPSACPALRGGPPPRAAHRCRRGLRRLGHRRLPPLHHRAAGTPRAHRPPGRMGGRRGAGQLPPGRRRRRGCARRRSRPGQGPVVAYLALPPAAFAPAIQALAVVGLPDGSRLVVEKPFGRSLGEARVLNRLLDRRFGKDAVFRADHVLGLQTVQNILGLRFANRVFEPLWNAGHVQRVQIAWEETVALEGRAGYYDHAGALRDMVQDHLLQLLCLVAMEPPTRLDPRHLHDRKVELLHAVQPPSPGEMATGTVRGRYTAGRVDGVDVPAYTEEPGVDPARGTETFAEVTLSVSNLRWAGVPFTLRTGKALARRRGEILVHFRAASHPTFPEASAAPTNLLRLGLDPDRLTLCDNLNGTGDPFRLEQAELERPLAPQELPAYGRLLLAVLQGDPTCRSAATRPSSAGGSPNRSSPPGQRTPCRCRSTRPARPGRRQPGPNNPHRKARR